jgi:hypothetical protein
MMVLAVFATVLLVGLPLSGALPSASGVWTETGDAGDVPAAAQFVPLDRLNRIRGALASASDVDLFRFRVRFPVLFSAETLPSGIGGVTLTDPSLSLYRLDGTGVAYNDNRTAGDARALLPAGNALLALLSVGDYLLAVAPAPRAPQSSGGAALFDVAASSGVLPPLNVSAQLAQWSGGGGGGGGSYEVALRGTDLFSDCPNPLPPGPPAPISFPPPINP